MRKWIIDTDTGGDDAAALMIAAASPDIEILGVTTVCGNVPLAQATQNALMALETAGAAVPVYCGAAQPLMRAPHNSVGVYGADGMGDCGLIHPAGHPQPMHAVDFIRHAVAQYPDEIEIIALAPATNIALAIMQDRETMRHVKHIWSMGTGGFGPGNATPVAEFNVYIDADAYAVMLDSGIPITIAGFDLCVGSAAFRPDELERMRATPQGRFLTDATRKLRAYNERRNGVSCVDLPDAVALTAALMPDLIQAQTDCFCCCCKTEEATYGQVIMYETGMEYEGTGVIARRNAAVIRQIDSDRFKRYFMHLFAEA